MKAWFTKLAGSRRPVSRQRGSVLVIVIGVLALMAILVTIYATLGQADRRTSTGVQRYTDLQSQVQDISEYLGSVIGRDTFKSHRVDNLFDPTDARGDTYVRNPETNPSIDPNLLSQTANPALRYRPTYFPSDGRPQNEALPPTNMVPGSILTRWNDPANPDRTSPDPRLAFTPFVAKPEPTWLRLSNGTMPNHTDPARPWLENRDYEIISNPSLDGRFVNLASIRNNFDARSGVGIDLLTGKPCTTYGLTLLQPNGDATLDLAPPPFWPQGRTQVSWNALPGAAVPYYPYDFTARQQSMFRRTVDARLRAAAVGSLARNYSASLALATLVPADWEYMDNQYADTNGDGIYDSRWFELRDASDPGNDGTFGTLDDVVKSLIRENGNLRIFVAAQIEDLSGKINVNTATQSRTLPDAMNPMGLDPAHVDLERALRMADVVWFFPNAGYETFAQPRFPFVSGTDSYNSNYKDSVSYGGIWQENNRDHSVADTIGATAFSALIDARVSGEVPPPGVGWARDPADFFAPLSVRAGLWPFDGSPNDKIQQSAWRPEYRTQLYRMFARDSGSWMISSKESNVRYGPWLYPQTDPIPQVRNRTDPRNRLADNSFQPGGTFGPASEIDLRSFEFMNNPLSTSPLELAAAGRFQAEAGRTFAHLSPLRENRPRDLEALSRDIVTPTRNGFNQTPDGDVDPDALLQAQVDRRHLLTVYNGNRTFAAKNVSGNLTSIDDGEVAVSIPDALAILSSDITEPTEQARRQAKITEIFRAAADATMPFASLRDARGGNPPRSSAWYVGLSGGALQSGSVRGGVANGEQKLFYGADRNFNRDFPYGGYIGNAGELSLRLTAQWTANLISLNRRPRTAIDPPNPIHPDDRADDSFVVGKVWDGVNGTTAFATNTNYFTYPSVAWNPLTDPNYSLYPRFPRGNTATYPADEARIQTSIAFSDAVEFRYNNDPTPTLVPVRTRSEAFDRPVVMSVLIDEGFRNKMNSVLADPVLNGRDEVTRAFPGWSKGDVAQVGTLAPQVMGRLDLAEANPDPSQTSPTPKPKLLPADGVTPTNSSSNPLDPVRAARLSDLAARGYNAYGIVPQPFIVAATGMMVYADTPFTGTSRQDPGDDPDSANGEKVPGSPNAGIPDAYNPTISGKVDAAGPNTVDVTGDLLPATDQKGFPDHIVEIFAFQLHNPFDTPLSLSALKDIFAADGTVLRNRTLPDQSRRKIRQDSQRGQGRVGQELGRLPKVTANTLMAVSLEETRYYIEFSGRYYAMVGTDPLGLERQAITLEPGETRWFYVSDNNLDDVYQRMRNADSGIGNLTSASGGDLNMVENWITNQLVTHEPLGMSYVNTATRTGLPNLQNISGNPALVLDHVKNIKKQPVFQNPPTRLVRIDPRTMQAVRPQPQPIPDSGADRRRFFDNRRAVRLWRVNREVDLTDNRTARDEAITSEGDLPVNGSVAYRNKPNMLGNDQLVDVLRDPKPWRKAQGDASFYELDGTEANWTAPTLSRRFSDNVPQKLFGESMSRADRTARNFNGPHEYDSIAIINWGSIRRPADPKVSMPLVRDDPTNTFTIPEVPLGVLPAYCLEVKSSLPYRAGLPLEGGVQSPYAVRTSLNWDLVNGRRRFKGDLTENTASDLDAVGTPFAALPLVTLFPVGGSSGANQTTNIDYPRVATNLGSPALHKLLERGLGVNGNPPARLHETINLAPQLQEPRDDADTNPRTSVKSHEPFFTDTPPPGLKAMQKVRLELLANRSGQSFTKMYMRIPMMLPPIHRAADRSVQVPEMRPADLLMIPAVGPYEIPLDKNGQPWHRHFGAALGLEPHDQRVLDLRWTTLAEAAAQALDFDFDDSWRADNGGDDLMPADYRIGGRLFDPTAAPVTSDIFNNEIDGCLDRGCFRTDGFVAYVDRYSADGSQTPDARYTPPSVQNIGAPLVGDLRPGNGVPMALNLLDQFRVHKFGSKTSMVQGLINLNTAPLSVKRTLPMLSPDVRGWLAAFGGGLANFGNSGPTTGLPHFDPLGQVLERDMFSPLDLSLGSLTNDQQRQLRSLYSNWYETSDVAATLEAYATKSIVTTRPIQVEGDRNRRTGIDVSFRSDLVDYNGQIRAPRLGEPDLGRFFQSGVTGLRESTGFESVGELLCARQGPSHQIDVTNPYGVVPYSSAADRYKVINNGTDLERDIGNFASSRLNHPQFPVLDYFGDVSVDRFARDQIRLAPSSVPLPRDATDLGYFNGMPIQGVRSAMTVDKVHQRGPMVPTIAVDTLDEKYVIANAALGTTSVRGDVFCVHFLVRGYSPTDVSGLSPEDPMIPSVERRYVMVVDRSNVVNIDDKPRVLFVQEVPLR